MQRDELSTKKVIKYILLILVIYIIQTTSGINTSFYGYHVDILPFVVATAGLLGGKTEGAVTGFIIGIFCDITGVSADGLHSIYYIAFGILCGFLGHKLLRRIYPSVLILGTLGIWVLGLIKMASILAFDKAFIPLLVLQDVCGQTLVCAMFSLLAYIPTRKIVES